MGQGNMYQFPILLSYFTDVDGTVPHSLQHEVAAEWVQKAIDNNELEGPFRYQY